MCVSVVILEPGKLTVKAVRLPDPFHMKLIDVCCIRRDLIRGSELLVKTNRVPGIRPSACLEGASGVVCCVGIDW